MSPALQAKYLRVLQEGTLRRLGGKGELPVDVRVVAATNKDPVQAVRGGGFREDLFYRLNVFSIAMPPLRQRKDDIPLLVEAFIEEFNAKYDKRVKGVDDAALQRLIRWHWPGNVRELRNAIERAVVGCSGDLVAPDCLPLAAAPPRRAGGRRGGSADPRGHDPRRRGAGAAAAHPGLGRQQQDPGRGDARHHPQDPAEQAGARRHGSREV